MVVRKSFVFENETYLDSNEIEEEIENSIEENNDSEELISKIKDKGTTIV